MSSPSLACPRCCLPAASGGRADAAAVHDNVVPRLPQSNRSEKRPRQLLVLTHVVPVGGTELTANLSRLRRRLLAVPAIAEFEITPVERAP